MSSPWPNAASTSPSAADSAAVAVAAPSNGTPMPASPGIAIGPALFLRTADVDIPDEQPGDQATEWRRTRAAIAEVRREIQRLRAAAAREVGETEARIFDAHLMLLDDPDLLDDVRARIRRRRWGDPRLGRRSRQGRGRDSRPSPTPTCGLGPRTLTR